MTVKSVLNQIDCKYICFVCPKIVQWRLRASVDPIVLLVISLHIYLMDIQTCSIP